MKTRLQPLALLLLLPLAAHAQVNSGSDGHDGAFNPTTNTVINMADHPNGIYHYTSVNISNAVTVTFIPNANNTPVVWLVQSNVVINGIVNVSGQSGDVTVGGIGGPGGWKGGIGGEASTAGQGPGGGQPKHQPLHSAATLHSEPQGSISPAQALGLSGKSTEIHFWFRF